MSREPPESLKPNTFQILLCLADKEFHGYGIRHEVLERTEGTLNLWPGMLYRTIGNLEDAGLVEACPPPASAPDDGRERKYYRATPAGRSALEAEARRMAAYVEAARSKAVFG